MAKGILIALAVTLTPAVSFGQQPTVESAGLRKQVVLMEGLLARAGTVAADTIARKLQELDPGISAFIGPARARGFIMEGYGIFFHVEVPELTGTVILSQMVMQREMQVGTALQDLRRALEDMPDGPMRQQALRAVMTLDRTAGPTNAEVKVSAASAATNAPAVWDPNDAYKQEVKRELIDAILNYSLPLNVTPDQWLEVGAHLSDSPGSQRGITLMIRVKGSDLAIFAADPARREEIRDKVEVREF